MFVSDAIAQDNQQVAKRRHPASAEFAPQRVANTPIQRSAFAIWPARDRAQEAGLLGGHAHAERGSRASAPEDDRSTGIAHGAGTVMPTSCNTCPSISTTTLTLHRFIAAWYRALYRTSWASS